VSAAARREALIVQGGWDGHEPGKVSEVFRQVLERERFAVTVSDRLESLEDAGLMRRIHLLVPIWTMGTIDQEQVEAVSAAVAGGVGMAGCHGGMCDAFRNSTLWQFITGGNWVAHPGGDGTEYTVNVRASSSGITDGIEDFAVSSEQYYLHVDPAVEVLATTRFPVADGPHAANGAVDMPVVWTKRWGAGRVFYNSLGHHADVIAADAPLELMRRGFLWAAGDL
jgi:type 1 glutamine amidotransferase